MKSVTPFTDLDLIIQVGYGAQNSIADLNTKDSWESLGQQGTEMKRVNPKGSQPWIFTGRIAAEAPILWLLDMKSWLIWKDPDDGKDWRQEEKGMTEWNGWMASLTRWTWVWVNYSSWWWTGKPGCCSPWGCRVGHDWVTELNWTEKAGQRLLVKILFGG